MGRGRAKAKQTKVARELKYHSPNTDLAALQRELGGGNKGRTVRLTSWMRSPTRTRTTSTTTTPRRTTTATGPPAPAEK